MAENKSAFGESVALPVLTEIMTSCAYGVIDDRNETFSATGGSVDTEDNLFRCQTGTSIGGYGVLRTKHAIVYHAGQAIRSRFTGMFTTGVPLSLQFAGLFSLTETLAFGYDGDSFGIIYESHGRAECRELEVTAAAGGAESATITFDGDAATANLTATTAAGNAFEIARDLNADATLGAKWNFFQNDGHVVAISKSVGPKSGTYSFSSATATATITQQKAGVAKTSNNIPREQWNMNASMVIDPTKMNIYEIDYGYLGSSAITFSVYDNEAGHFVPVHRMESKNQTKTNLGNPNLKVGWTAASLGSSGTNLVVKGASACIQKVSQEHEIEVGARAVESSKTGVDTNLINLITVRNRGHYGYLYNLGEILAVSASINNDHNKAIRVEFLKDATLGGVCNFTYANKNDSILEYDTSGTTVTGGELIDSFLVGATSSENFNIFGVLEPLAPRETLTIAVKTVSGTGAAVDCALAWKEDK